MLLDGCVDQRVEACEAEVEYVHEAGEVSRSTDSRTTSLYRRSVLLPAPAGSSHLPSGRVQTAGSGGMFSHASFARTRS